MKSQKLLVSLIIILVIGVIAEGVYLVSLKKRLDNFGNISAKAGSSVFPKKPSISGFSQRGFNSDWYWDDFFNDRWEPFEEMKRMQQRLNKMFNENFGRGVKSWGHTPFAKGNFFEPDIDIKEDGTQYTVTMDLPGMDKDKINIEIKNKMLKITGERETVSEENRADKFFRQERNYGYFSRVIPLPDNIKENEISADYKNGVLTIKIPKAVAAEGKDEESRKIKIF
jgi:HSP20 family protein